VRFLLQEELREPRNHFAVLEAIATGHARLNEIKQAIDLDMQVEHARGGQQRAQGVGG